MLTQAEELLDHKTVHFIPSIVTWAEITQQLQFYLQPSINMDTSPENLVPGIGSSLHFYLAIKNWGGEAWTHLANQKSGVPNSHDWQTPRSQHQHESVGISNHGHVWHLNAHGSWICWCTQCITWIECDFHLVGNGWKWNSLLWILHIYIYIYPPSQRPRKTWSFKSEVKDHTLLLKT